MSMYGWDLPVVPGPPKADLQFRVLEEWLTNPFLDDDVTALSLRLGDPVAVLEEALKTLCGNGFLRATGTGFMLALDLGGSLPALDDDTQAELDPHEKAAVQLASLSGAIAIDPVTETDDDGEDFLDLLAVHNRGAAVAREIESAPTELSSPTDGVDPFQLIEKLPFGMVVLLPTGARQMANRQAADMLGVAPEQIDGATFEMLTGVNPLAALETATPLSFSLTAPRPLEVTLQGHSLPSGSVILILLRDVSLLEEVSKIQAEVQEELFQRLKTDMVDPLAMLERFLEAPDADKLVQARIAMEQINWFLQEFFLLDKQN